MITLALASVLTCTEVSLFLTNLASVDIPDAIKVELQEEIKSSAPVSCNFN